jgi:hypothetical protein
MTGMMCDDPADFCKLPIGKCCCDHQGVCTERPNGCPENWDPVCGCDNNTYGNECEADAAGVSINYLGECEIVCAPADDGLGCVPDFCSAIPEEKCVALAYEVNPLTGDIQTSSCECLDFNTCHIEFTNAGPVPAGWCPANDQACVIVGSDTDDDGIDDHFEATCDSVDIGVCCYDVSGGPLPLVICDPSTAEQCETNGGMFGDGVCEEPSACCLFTVGFGYCTHMSESCCLAWGGEPQGPDSLCGVGDPDPVACQEICGGVLGIVCENPDQFCQLPIGACCCDFQGVCTDIPDACPENWDPVCGCDGTTYSNLCFAAANGVSVDYIGECAVACVPNDDGFGCVQVNCSDIPEEQCIPAELHLDILTGAITTLDCTCQDFNACHIEFGNASPFAVGYCPGDQTCEVVASDSDNDGIDDTFSAACTGGELGTCCFDISDGPIPLETCETAGFEECVLAGGVFYQAGSGCDEIEACCLGFAGATFCAEIARGCCIMSGGVPQGPNSACGDGTDPDNSGCGQMCGGITGIPCTDPATYCKLPDGHCCCDFMGTCEPIAEVCVDVWEPVCGCDGITYGNDCEAAAAGMSVDYEGECVP